MRRVPHSRPREESLSDQALDRGMRRLSTSLPTKTVDKRPACACRRRGASRGSAAYRVASVCRMPHSRQRKESLSDQMLDRSMRRLSTCLPTKSGEKSGRPRSRDHAIAWRRTETACDAPRCRIRDAQRVSLRDQGVIAGLRRISTSLPTKTVGKWRDAARAPDAASARAEQAWCGRRNNRTRRAAAARPPCITHAKARRIKGLARRCAGYPQACQQNLWTSRASRRLQAGALKRTVTVSPRPPALVPSLTVARCCSAIRLTIDKPSPLPDDVAACAPAPR